MGLQKYVKGGLTATLGTAFASMFFCLPCWIPFLMFLNAIGLSGAFVTKYALLIKVVPLVFTSLIILWLGCWRQFGDAVLCSVWIMAVPNIFGYLGYLVLGWLLLKAKKTECKIVR